MHKFDDFIDKMLSEATIWAIQNELAVASAFRRSPEFKQALYSSLNEGALCESEEELSEFVSGFDINEIAELENLIDAYYESEEFDEAKEEIDKDNIDPVDGEDDDDLDEMQKKSASERKKANLKAKKWRMKNKSKVVQAQRRSEKRQAAGTFDKSRSRLMKKVSKLYNSDDDEVFEEDDEDEVNEMFDAIVASVINDIDNVRSIYEEEDDEDFPSPKDLPEDDDEEEDYDDDDDIEEAKKTRAEKDKANKAAKKWRNTSAGKKSIEKTIKKTSRAGYKVDPTLSKKMTKAAALRKEAVQESIEVQLMKFDGFGILNEAQSEDIKLLMTETISEVVNKQAEYLAEEYEYLAEEYIKTEILPTFDSYADYVQNEVMSNISEGITDDIDKYLSYIAEEMSDEALSHLNEAQSVKAERLVDFSESLLELIKDKLNIIPEQEDMVHVLEKQNSKLQEALDDALITKAKLSQNLTEQRISAVAEKIKRSQKLSSFMCEQVDAFIDESDNLTAINANKLIMEFIGSHSEAPKQQFVNTFGNPVTPQFSEDSNKNALASALKLK